MHGRFSAHKWAGRSLINNMKNQYPVRSTMSLAVRIVPCLLFVVSLAAQAATEEQINKRFTASPGGTVVVDVDFGSINVSTNAGSEVVVDVWRKVSRSSKSDEEKFLRDNPVKFDQEGGTVTIKCATKSVTRR